MESSERADEGARTLKIAHLSDVHFGRISHPEIVESIVSDVNEAGVDLVVVSGDLTQRARKGQYRAAARMLASFDAPWLAVPGNHDVYPWWRPFSRLVDPLRRFRKWITPDLAPGFEVPGLAVLGINSAYGWTVQGGRMDASQRDAMRAFFGSVAPGAFRVLVVHHHLTQLEALGQHDLARQARATLALAADLSVDLVLCGHLHISHMSHIEVLPEGHGLVVATAGTATSDRGRKEFRDTNFYKQISITDTAFEIAERQFDPDTIRFEEVRRAEFERKR